MKTGAPLLGLAKAIYYTYRSSLNFVTLQGSLLVLHANFAPQQIIFYCFELFFDHFVSYVCRNVNFALCTH